ncbi:MAG: hypothetical protein ACP5IO_03845 [Elusimicrobiales bacterium]
MRFFYSIISNENDRIPVNEINKTIENYEYEKRRLDYHALKEKL